MIKWSLLIIFAISGFYFMAWSFQSASYSVPESPIMSEIYKTRAMILLPVSLLFIAQGILFFIIFNKRK